MVDLMSNPSLKEQLVLNLVYAESNVQKAISKCEMLGFTDRAAELEKEREKLYETLMFVLSILGQAT